MNHPISPLLYTRQEDKYAHRSTPRKEPKIRMGVPPPAGPYMGEIPETSGGDPVILTHDVRIGMIY